MLRKSAKRLESAGANFIIIACNSAHHYYKEIKRSVSIPVVNGIQEVALYIKKNFGGVKRVGILTTTGLIHSRIYHRILEKGGYKVLEPDRGIQENSVMKAIYLAKGTVSSFILRSAEPLIEKAIIHLKGKGAEVIILGCTEIPLIIHNRERCGVPLVDFSRVLAVRAVALAVRC
jgi:aspartate racemase